MWIKKYSKYIIAVFAAAAVTDGLLTWVNSAGIRYIGGLENIHIIYCTVAIASVSYTHLFFGDRRYIPQRQLQNRG